MGTVAPAGMVIGIGPRETGGSPGAPASGKPGPVFPAKPNLGKQGPDRIGSPKIQIITKEFFIVGRFPQRIEGNVAPWSGNTVTMTGQIRLIFQFHQNLGGSCNQLIQIGIGPRI